MSKFLSDIEIAQAANKIEIHEVAKRANFDKEAVLPFGKYKAKLDITKINSNKKGKLVLVTATSPTPAGEGKTTTSVGLNDGFNKAGFNSIIALREASLGPVFGIKGGATGGGQAQIVPIEDINLHFTGDFHAITSANNLIAAALDNSIYFGNKLDIKKVIWKRCIDMNDRSLRNISYNVKKNQPLETGFQITAASEIMTTLALCSDMEDLRKRVDRIILGYNSEDKPVFVKELGITGSVLALLKEAILPNLVQSLENNPAIVHAGPFANIAHGCNSAIATKLALKTADYVITEAGFGSDLGAEKFLNIKSRAAGLKPGAVVLVTTIKALKMHGGVPKDELGSENVEALKNGMSNLIQHHESLSKFGIPVVVTLNHFVNDTDAEVQVIKDWANKNDIPFAVSKAWELGGEGSLELVEKVNSVFKETTPKFTYDINDSIEEKINKVAVNVYGAEGINLSDQAKEQIKTIEANNLDKQMICIAKTPVSFSDDPKLLGAPKGWKLNVEAVKVDNGAGFIVIIAGSIMTMPGLGKVPAATVIDVVNDEIINLS